ncbi:MAG: dihydroorotase family protein [Candidatus Bathyarchaeota archaeon]|nr:MAG: dihydroorotase family protein [Candidatus Bathyarchaeota archaeon]
MVDANNGALPMTVDCVLHNGKLYFEGTIIEGGLAIDGDRIVKIGREPNLPAAGERIDLNRCLVLPGLIDAHVHLRGQRLAYKEDFLSGTQAAVAGGFTTVLDMPNNEPVICSVDSVRKRVELAERKIVANVGFLSSFPHRTDEIADIVREGATAFKLYLSEQIGGVNIEDDDELLQAFTEVSRLNMPLAVHAEDAKMIKNRTNVEKAAGNNDVEAYCRAHPPEAEVKAARRVLQLAEKTKVRVHLCHVSSEETVALVNEAKKKGMDVSCEATPHHLMATSRLLTDLGAPALTDPPLREKKVMEALWGGVREKVIDLVASDHAPHSIREKTADSVWSVRPGVPGLETTLPLLLTKVNEGLLTVNDVVRLLAEKPAQIFGIQDAGFLSEGGMADITVVDLHRVGRIDVDRFHSKAEYSPFDGWKVKGLPVKVFVNGTLVLDKDEVVADEGIGRVLRSRKSLTK